MIKEAYQAGQIHFGENYVQELVDKAPQMPAEVQWHFIGHLQSNKVGQLVKGCQSVLLPRKIGELELEFEILTWSSNWYFEEFNVEFTVRFTTNDVTNLIVCNFTLNI